MEGFQELLKEVSDMIPSPSPDRDISFEEWLDQHPPLSDHDLEMMRLRMEPEEDKILFGGKE